MLPQVCANSLNVGPSQKLKKSTNHFNNSSYHITSSDMMQVHGIHQMLSYSSRFDGIVYHLALHDTGFKSHWVVRCSITG